MASLPTRTTASFDAIKPVSSLVPLDDELNDIKGATGFLNGGTTGKKLLVKTSDGADPPIECDQVGAGPLARFKLSGAAKVTIGNDGLITCANTGVNPGLNADRVDGIEGSAIAQIGVSKAYFALAFKIEDPSTLPLNDTAQLTVLRVPNIQSGFLTRMHIIRYAGSHTSGGSVTFKPNVDAAAIGSGVSFNDTNSAGFTFYSDDFTDLAIGNGSAVTVVISARSGTVSERAVSITLEGYQTIKA